jgi:hypothetical protein
MKIPKVYFYCRNETENLQEDVIAIIGDNQLRLTIFSFGTIQTSGRKTATS